MIPNNNCHFKVRFYTRSLQTRDTMAAPSNDDWWTHLGWTYEDARQYLATEEALKGEARGAARRRARGEPPVDEDGYERVTGRRALNEAMEEEHLCKVFAKNREERRRYGYRSRHPLKDINKDNVDAYAHLLGVNVIRENHENKQHNATSPSPIPVPTPVYSPATFVSYSAAAAAPAAPAPAAATVASAAASLSPRKVHYFAYQKKEKVVICYMWTTVVIHGLSWEQITWMKDFIVSRAGQADESGKPGKSYKGPYGTDLENDVFLQLEEAVNKCPGGVFVYEKSRIIKT